MLSAESGQWLQEIFRGFWPYTRGDRKRLLAAGIFAVMVAGGEIGTVLIFDSITGRVLGLGRMGAFWPPAGAWLSIALITAAAMFTGGYLRSLARERFLLRLRDSAFARTQLLSPDFFGKQRLGDLMVRLTEDLEVIEELVSSGLVEAAAAAVSVVLFAAAAIFIQWQLALITFGGGAVFLACLERILRPHQPGLRAGTGGQQLAGQRGRGKPGQPGPRPGIQPANRAGRPAPRRRRFLAARENGRGQAALALRAGRVLHRDHLRPDRVRIRRLGSGRAPPHHPGLLSFAILLAYIYPEIQDLSEYRVNLAAGRASAQRVTDILTVRPLVSDRAERGGEI
jgi:ATP-binding cassette subfamily B protein